jgi:hypothetical protein
VKPFRLIETAFDGAQLTVAVTVELAPPGTDAGDRLTLRRAGEQDAAALPVIPGSARADDAACAGWAAMTTVAPRRPSAAIPRTDPRSFTRPRSQYRYFSTQ